MVARSATLTPVIYSRLHHPGSSESREEKDWTCEGSKDAGVESEMKIGGPVIVLLSYVHL